MAQRAYTLKVRGSGTNDSEWREALWQTHVAVNRGAKVFGDWLLTLRGGISHDLAEVPVKGKKGTVAPPSEELRRQRRILLALSWLAVESEAGAPVSFLVPRQEGGGKRAWRVVETLEEILRLRGLGDDDIASWISDCRPSLSARIRKDAVWVDRSAAFDDAVKALDGGLERQDGWDLLGRFLGDASAYLAPLSKADRKSPEAGAEAMDTEASDDTAQRDLVMHAGQWLSARAGTGEGADFERFARVYEVIQGWASSAAGPRLSSLAAEDVLEGLRREGFEPQGEGFEAIQALISGPGYKSATKNLLKALAAANQAEQELLDKISSTAREDASTSRAKVGKKGPKAWSDRILADVARAAGFSYLPEAEGPARHREYSVMLDHAARRVCVAHSWIKRAEADRREFQSDAQRLDLVPGQARRWLETYCERRSAESGAEDAYRIRRRAVEAWKRVAEAWKDHESATEADRVSLARQLQADPEIPKFGDIQLFSALAGDDAEVVWRQNGKVAPEVLLAYAAATDAADRQVRFKVPAYRHPDELLHPVFCDYGNSRWRVEFGALKRSGGTNLKGILMRALTSEGLEYVSLAWQCKRLEADLALSQGEPPEGACTVTRADRLGRAAAGAGTSGPVKILGIFEEKEWNARLQIPRDQLDALALLRDDRSLDPEERRRKEATAKAHLEWFVSFSARLQPKGPWYELSAKLGAKPGRNFYPHAEENKNRKGRARLDLARIPGLRVLGVDLGHRYAAACAVWEAMSKGQVQDFCKANGVLVPASDAMYFLPVIAGRKVVFRRVGPDSAPASWARLDRQFLVKLQGEDEKARKSGPEEYDACGRLAQALGHVPPVDLPHQVDELMDQAIRMARLGLKRHGNRARIAFLLANGEQPAVLQALVLWLEAISTDRWQDIPAAQLWQTKVGRLLTGGLPAPPEADAGGSATFRRWLKAIESDLVPVAGAITADQALKSQLAGKWADLWKVADEEWPKRLRWLRSWILDDRGNPGSRRHVGGLSLRRLATLRELYRLQKAFKQRPEPDGLRKNVPAKGDDSLDRFGQKILDALEQLRDNRIKQLASRLGCAALGLDEKLAPRKDDPRFEQCQAIVIESLRHYRPDEKRTRRENRQLMDWSAGNLRSHLEDLCELHGLYLREVPAAYTSRQDSRTGAPGLRCTDVPEVDVFKESGFWAREAQQARDRLAKASDGTPRRREIDAYFGFLLENRPASPVKHRSVRIPRKGGEVFVSADQGSPAASGIQADLNAAANIGLRALIDPDWPGAWSYVPCDPKTGRPLADVVKGSVVFDTNTALKVAETTKSDEAASAKGKAINYWRDAAPTLAEDGWLDYRAYTGTVEARVVSILTHQYLERTASLAPAGSGPR